MEDMMTAEFALGDVFSFSAIKQAKSQRLIPSDKNGVPYVVQSTTNNMVARTVDKQWLIDHNESPVPGNALVLGVTLPAVSYQPSEFGASQVIVARNPLMTELSGQYLASLLEKQMAAFSYTRKPGLKIYKAMTISLPVHPSPDPDHVYTPDDIDWGYMERYIAELEAERIAELEAYLVATGLDDCELTDEDEAALACEPPMAEYKISDLFSSVNGDIDLKKEHINGKGLPVISSGVAGMGIIGDTDKDARIIPANTITVDMFGNAFYRDFEYKIVTHARVFALIPKGYTLNNQRGNALVSFLAWLPRVFSYNNMCSFAKLKGLTISLPVHPSPDSDHAYTPDDIDWGYMERYIRAVEKQVMADVAAYKDEVIATTRRIVGGGADDAGAAGQAVRP